MYRRLTILALLIAFATLAFAGVASAATVKGKVVHKNASAHSFTVAIAGGQLVTIHAKRSPALGRRVVVQARLLNNGTFAAESIAVGRATGTARVHGVITFVNARHTRFAVSGKGVSLVVRKHALTRLPAVGTVVTVDGVFTRQGDIAAHDCHDCGTNDGYVELEGHVLSVDPALRTLTLSADDDEELPGTITLAIPATWDFAAYAVGDELEVLATLNADGSYTAVATCKDGDGDCDDDDCEQGDDRVDIEGHVRSIDTAARTLTMRVDEDDAMAGAVVVVSVPAPWDITAYAVGDDFEIVATLNADGSYTAVSIEQDDAHADDAKHHCAADHCADDCADDHCADDCATDHCADDHPTTGVDDDGDGDYDDCGDGDK